MPAPLFHRKGGDGVQELKLYTDVSSKSAFILKVGSGKAEKPVRLPKSDPLQKARSALDNAIPENLVDNIDSDDLLINPEMIKKGGGVSVWLL